VFQPRVLAQATVDPGVFEVADRINDLPFVVHVTGQLEGGDPLPDRDYEIADIDMPHAAFAGLARYEHEMRRVN
jgi:hypothetical protein